MTDTCSEARACKRRGINLMRLSGQLQRGTTAPGRNGGGHNHNEAGWTLARMHRNAGERSTPYPPVQPRKITGGPPCSVSPCSHMPWGSHAQGGATAWHGAAWHGADCATRVHHPRQGLKPLAPANPAPLPRPLGSPTPALPAPPEGSASSRSSSGRGYADAIDFDWRALFDRA